MSKPIPSTRGVYMPGVGMTITQANIADEQKRRTKNGEDPADADDILKAFLTDHRAPIEPRHRRRAERLMARG